MFGKNTTAGAVNITTKLPTFEPTGEFEGSLGNYGFVQAKGAVSGPLTDDLAFRLAVGKTVRNGFITSTQTGRSVNDLDNFAVRGQLLWKLGNATTIRLSADYNLSDADCCTQVFAGYGRTLKSADRQFPALAAALGYAPPSLNPYDRLADVDGQLNARSEIGGASLLVDHDFGAATLTSVSAYRWWDWQPANDRDYTALDILPQSANPVQQDQWTQEIRLASNGTHTIDYTVGVYAFYQILHGQNVTEWGKDAAFWLLGTQTAATATSPATPIPSNLLDGYITTSDARSTTQSYAGFAQLTWHITDSLRFTPGLRYTYEKKDADYAAVVSGGLATTNAALQAAKLSIFRPQAYQVAFDAGALTGDANLSWQATEAVLVYASYARGFKSGGINLAGLPFNSTNNPALNRAVVSPEKSNAYEVGIKSQWFNRLLTANLALFRTDVRDFQANVVDTGPGALRGYLANVAKVRSQGVEWDLVLSPVSGLSGYVRGAYTDAKYISFANAPCPLELIGNSTTVCDLSGKQLPGTPKLSVSYGGEYRKPISLGGSAYIGFQANSRSSNYADASRLEISADPSLHDRRSARGFRLRSWVGGLCHGPQPVRQGLYNFADAAVRQFGDDFGRAGRSAHGSGHRALPLLSYCRPISGPSPSHGDEQVRKSKRPGRFQPGRLRDDHSSAPLSHLRPRTRCSQAELKIFPEPRPLPVCQFLKARCGAGLCHRECGLIESIAATLWRLRNRADQLPDTHSRS